MFNDYINKQGFTLCWVLIALTGPGVAITSRQECCQEIVDDLITSMSKIDNVAYGISKIIIDEENTINNYDCDPV